MPMVSRSVQFCVPALVAIAIASALTTEEADAQVCFRGRPAPTCRSFLLTEAEAGVVLPLGGTAGGTSGTGGRLGVDVGWMRNVGTRSAIGVTIRCT